MNPYPIAETLRQIAPGNAGPIPVEHRLDEQPVVSRRHPDVTLPPGKKVSDTLPLIVSQAVASHGSAPHQLTPDESKFAPRRNPLNDDTL